MTITIAIATFVKYWKKKGTSRLSKAISAEQQFNISYSGRGGKFNQGSRSKKTNLRGGEGRGRNKSGPRERLENRGYEHLRRPEEVLLQVEKIGADKKGQPVAAEVWRRVRSGQPAGLVFGN